MRDAVRRVGMTITALLGVGLGGSACGGTTGQNSGNDAGEGFDAPAPDTGPATCDGGHAPAFHLATACGKDTPMTAGGMATGYATCADGVLHRPTVTACPNLLVEAKPGSCTQPGSCTSSSACAAMGSHGTCTADPSPGYCSCTSGCVTDSDCGKGEICECGTEIGVCVPAKCTVDSECGKGLLCANSPAGMPNVCGGGPEGFACQTEKDSCLSGTDCAPGCPGHTSPICVVEPSGERACAPGCTLGIGRPFLVGDGARVAPVVRGDRWARGSRPADLHLSAQARAELGDAWTRIAQMEHASVAAFARFALELMALGAPVDLLRWSQRAMSEEIDHAARAFALASAYRGSAVGPGPLDVGGALRMPTAKSVLRTLVREGCIGETLAAVEAAAALERAKDPSVRSTLEVVVRDESSHAALAWSTVRWLLAESGDDLRAWLATEFEIAVRERRTGASPSAAREDEATLEEHGILSAEHVRALHRAALKDLVQPCAAALLA